MRIGGGKLGNAIREAVKYPFNDEAEPHDYPHWSGTHADFTLHVHRDSDLRLWWQVGVTYRDPDGMAEEDIRLFCYRMAECCLLHLGRWHTLEPVSLGHDFGVWRRLLTRAEEDFLRLVAEFPNSLPACEALSAAQDATSVSTEANPFLGEKETASGQPEASSAKVSA